MPSERTLDVLRNYIAKHEHSTDANHIRIVEFARKRLAQGLLPQTIEPNKWDESTSTGTGKTPLFTDDDRVSYTNYYGSYSSHYVIEEPKTSIFASVCRNLAWKGRVSMVHRAAQ